MFNINDYEEAIRKFFDMKETELNFQMFFTPGFSSMPCKKEKAGNFYISLGAGRICRNKLRVRRGSIIIFTEDADHHDVDKMAVIHI